MRAPRLLALRLFAVLFGLLIAFLVLELGFRVAGIGGPAELGPTFDRSLVHYLPDAARQPSWEGEDVLRIAVIGDSFTVGEANAWDDGYPERLERLLNLNADAPPAVVWTLAEKGTQTIDQLRFMRRALDHDIGMIILGIFLNDVEDSEDWELDRLMERTRPRPPPPWALGTVRASRVLAWTYQRLEKIRTGREVAAYFRRIYHPEYAGWKKFERSIQIFARACRRREVSLVAAIFPAMGNLGPHYPQRAEHRQIGQALERHRVPYLDLLDHFADKSDLRMAAYPGIDAHPSEIAHRIAAQAIFRFLLDDGHLDPVYEPDHVYREKSLDQWRRDVLRNRSIVYAP